jgi:CHAD domain
MNRMRSDIAHDLLLAETGRALTRLAPARLNDKRVHAARKALKSARTALRLLRPRLGEITYMLENGALRDAAHDLAPVRDARSLLGSLDLLGRRTRQRKPVRSALGRLRPLLQVRLRQARKDLASDPVMLRRCGDRIRGCRDRVRAMLDEPGDARQLLERFTRIYRKARTAWRQAESARSDEALHEWRKQTKYLLTGATALRGAGVKKLHSTARRALRIADRLGDDHDLAMLRRALFDFAGDSDSRLLAPLIERRRAKLQRRALRDAERLFARRPRRVTTLVSKSIAAVTPPRVLRGVAAAPARRARRRRTQYPPQSVRKSRDRR